MKEGGGQAVIVDRIPTGISGFDFITHGGLPRGRATLVSGSSGSGKTVFAAQFLAEGVRKSAQPGVFVTFEEPPVDIRKNVGALGLDVAGMEKAGTWAFVDASPEHRGEVIQAGGFDLGALMARMESAVRKVGAERLVLDSLGAVFNQFDDPGMIRSELFRIVTALKAMGVTSVMTAERVDEYGEIARYGVEEFVTDNVVILRNVLEEEKRRRTLEILKIRGGTHQKGEFPFTILPNEGIVVVPLSAIELKQSSTNLRIASGSEDLDAMCGGGFFRDSIVLV